MRTARGPRLNQHEVVRYPPKRTGLSDLEFSSTRTQMAWTKPGVSWLAASDSWRRRSGSSLRRCRSSPLSSRTPPRINMTMDMLDVQHRVPPDSMVPARNMIPPLICIWDGDALPHAVFAPGNPIPTICTFIGCWTPWCVALLVVQHRVPPDSMVPAESMLVQIDVHLAAAEKSCTNVHTICHNDALPYAVFAPGNPIPAVCTFIGCWTPRCVTLWQELTRFHDVLDALDGVLFALRTLCSRGHRRARAISRKTGASESAKLYAWLHSGCEQERFLAEPAGP
ncbi:hypothetical protein B0H14DRAFT_141257 [Mycena olivaceomarginata]|nr:hypothetical protein B0H14DRAFT_141257 [Mycena olivaceomarginata]